MNTNGTAAADGLTLAALGISPTMAMAMSLILGSTPPEKAGSAASISGASGEFGVAVGVAALGSVATLAYRTHLDLSSGTPAEAAEAARQGITEATRVAAEVSGALGVEVLAAARAAFTVGLTTVASVGAVVFLGLAVFVAVAFRHVPATEPVVEANQTPPQKRGPSAVEV